MKIARNKIGFCSEIYFDPHSLFFCQGIKARESVDCLETYQVLTIS
jgi:hypothetical protein